MRSSIILFLPVLALTVSCGTYAGYSAQQRYSDGIYTRYAAAVDAKPLYTVDDFDAMARRNLAAKRQEAGAAATRDTVYVVLQDNRNDYAWNGWWIAPWAVSYGFYNSWYYGPRYYGYRNPWYYDPWYYDPWFYDPWYYRPYHYGYRPVPRHSGGPQFGGGHGARPGSVSGRPASGSGGRGGYTVTHNYGASGTSVIGSRSASGGNGSHSGGSSHSSGGSVTHTRGYNSSSGSSHGSGSSSGTSTTRSYNSSSSSSYSSGSSRSYSSGSSHSGGSSYGGGSHGGGYGGGSHSGGGSSRGGGRR